MNSKIKQQLFKRVEKNEDTIKQLFLEILSSQIPMSIEKIMAEFKKQSNIHLDVNTTRKYIKLLRNEGQPIVANSRGYWLGDSRDLNTYINKREWEILEELTALDRMREGI